VAHDRQTITSGSGSRNFQERREASLSQLQGDVRGSGAMMRKTG
jgi:hypothetical protein